MLVVSAGDEKLDRVNVSAFLLRKLEDFPAKFDLLFLMQLLKLLRVFLLTIFITILKPHKFF